jgi:hypothetical protein
MMGRFKVELREADGTRTATGRGPIRESRASINATLRFRLQLLSVSLLKFHGGTSSAAAVREVAMEATAAIPFGGMQAKPTRRLTS